MKQLIECIIVGGPQHGLISRQLRDPEYTAPLALVTDDGQTCIAAACRPAGSAGNRFILLHPQATGRQLTAMLTTLNNHIASVCATLAA
ncbi:MAG: hypothetical protein ACYCZD_05750 [Rhodanobacter sp.]